MRGSETLRGIPAPSPPAPPPSPQPPVAVAAHGAVPAPSATPGGDSGHGVVAGPADVGLGGAEKRLCLREIITGL